ncbi:hypothetical protein HYX58_05980 [Candidatus Dependentiae bacterium]|nr:hypothetical protein [Candidatus Dependentiae bacterium]
MLANLTVTATADLSGVFTALNACCEGTFSVLANLTVTATADLSGVFSALAACCDGTFSSLFDIKNTLTACGAIPIFTSTDITASGNYCLANDIIGTITISSSEVHLDLNGFSVIAPGVASGVGTINIANVDNVSVRNGQLYGLGIIASNCNDLTLDSIRSFSCSNADIDCSAINGLAVTNYSIFNHFRDSSICVTSASSNNLLFKNFSINNSRYANAFAMDSIDTCQIINAVLNNPGVSSAGTAALSNMRNLSFANILSQAGVISVTTGTAITMENVQMAGSTNGLASLANIRDVSIVDCTYFDSVALVPVCSIITGTNIVIRNLNVENCSALNLLSLVPAIDVIFENVNASECVFSSEAISANNAAFGGTALGAQFTFDNVTINNCTLPRAINLNLVSDVGMSRFKVTHNSSTITPISFATMDLAPKVFIDDCIFSDNSSSAVATGNIILATDCDATRINNVVIEKNTYAGSQNGIVLQSLMLTVSAAEITNCRLENNSIAGDGLPECNLIQVSGIANSIIANNNISGNTIIRGDFGAANIFHGILNAGSVNAIIRENTLLGNLWTTSVDCNLIETTTAASIEYNTITGNVVGNDLIGISAASVDHAIIRGNVVNFNRCGAFPIATGSGAATGIVASGADVVVEKNILNSNIGGAGGSIGLDVAGTSMVTMNEAQGHTQDYRALGGLVIPIAQLSYANGIILPIPSNAPLSSYHNLEMVSNALTPPCDICTVFTVLANLSITTTVDFSPVFTALNACCNGTFSVLANLNLNLSPVFTQVAAGFNGTFSALTACCNGTFSSLADLRSSLTCQAAPITAPTNIVVSGPYCLQNDIVGTITVSANNVSINMNSRRLLNGGIQVSGVRNINIYNGVIDNGNGALVSSSTAVTFDHVEIVNVAGPSGVAINIVNSDDVLFNQDTIHALTGQLFINTSTGARFVNCDIFDNTITGTIVNILRAGGAQMAGCRLYNNSSQNTIGVGSSSNTIVQNCNFHDNAITGSIIASAGNNNTTLIDSCILYNNRSTDGFIGIGIASTDGDIAVQNCDINGNRAATGIFSAIFNAGSLSTIRNNLIRNNTLTGGTSFSISDHTNPFTATIIGNQADNGSATNYDISPGAILTASLIKTTATLMMPATTFHNLLLLP